MLNSALSFFSFPFLQLPFKRHYCLNIYSVVSKCCGAVSSELKSQHLPQGSCDCLQAQACWQSLKWGRSEEGHGTMAFQPVPPIPPNRCCLLYVSALIAHGLMFPDMLAYTVCGRLTERGTPSVQLRGSHSWWGETYWYEKQLWGYPCSVSNFIKLNGLSS